MCQPTQSVKRCFYRKEGVQLCLLVFCMISSNADEAYHIPSIETNFADCVIDVDCLLCLFFFLVACVRLRFCARWCHTHLHTGDTRARSHAHEYTLAEVNMYAHTHTHTHIHT